MKKYLSLFICTLIILLFISPVFADNSASFQFADDGKFKILHLTDTQDDAYPSPDMLNLLKKSIEFSDPDLIVFTGDLIEDSRTGDTSGDSQPFKEGVLVKSITGKIDYAKTRKNVEKAVDSVFSVFEKYEIPYVIALGNNDRHVGLSGSDWAEIFSAYPHCVFFDESTDEADGVDYHVTIKGNDGTDKFILWLMDTGNYGISDEQIDWFKSENARITDANGGTAIPSIVFQHINADDIGNLFVPCKATDVGARKVDGGYVRLNDEIASGYNFFGYEPCESSYEFQAWKESGSVLGAFFGHQHVEGFSGEYDGITLGFTYGCEFAKTGPYGFRTITIDENDTSSFETDLYRYTGNKTLGNVKIVNEEDITGEPSNSLISVFTRAFQRILTIISLITNLFR